MQSALVGKTGKNQNRQIDVGVGDLDVFFTIIKLVPWHGCVDSSKPETS